MKKYLKIILPALIILTALSGTLFAQKARTPENTAREFYAWYIDSSNRNVFPINQKTKMKKYISRRLAGWVYSNFYAEYGADYFLDAQDWEAKWRPAVSKADVKGNSAFLTVTLDVPKGVRTNWKKHVLPLKLVREDGVWKIDEVNNRKLIREVN